MNGIKLVESYKYIKIKERTYICNECGNKIDRDLNASINLANYK